MESSEKLKLPGPEIGLATYLSTKWTMEDTRTRLSTGLEQKNELNFRS